MLDFEKYLMRYGECSVQALVEQIERVERIPSSDGRSLEERWNALMRSPAVLAA